MAVDPTAKPMATTKAFNLGLLGIIELLLMGRSTDTPCEHASVRRKSAMPTPHPAAKPPSPVRFLTYAAPVDTTRMRIARPVPSTTGGLRNRKQM
jgi:hypothetical protein